MKLFSRPPNRNKPFNPLYLLIILVVLIIAITMWLRDPKENISSTQLTDSIQKAAFDLLEKDETISSFTIESIELSHINDKSEEVYLLEYSMKLVDPENFYLIGGGIAGEDGWIRERINYVTVTKDQKLIFSINP